MSSTRAEDVVRRYYRVVGDLGSTEADLAALLHPTVRVVEHPNAITPHGAVRDRDGVLAGFRAGKALLSEQEFAVHEVVAHGDRVAVRARWRATVGAGRGPLAAGTAIEAHVASFLTVEDGRIREHETYDCYPPGLTRPATPGS